VCVGNAKLAEVCSSGQTVACLGAMGRRQTVQVQRACVWVRVCVGVAICIYLYHAHSYYI